MDVRIGQVRARPLPARRPADQTQEEGLGREFSAGLTRVLAAQKAAGWEWALAIAAVFILGRSPVLFVRQRLEGAFGSRPGPIWTDDIFLLVVFGGVLLAVVVAAARRANFDALLHQPLLLALLVLAWVSQIWSVEPAVTARRAALFAGTAALGWYIGDRFRPRDQVRIVARVAALGAGLSFVAFFIWPQARATSGVEGLLSGVYVNRNLLGLVLSFGALAIVFLFPSSKRRGLLILALVGIGIMLVGTQSRTGPAGLAVALVTTAFVYYIRNQGRKHLTANGGALFTISTLGSAGLLVHWYWGSILEYLGRNPSLTNRRFIWEVDRWLARLRPWEGWGFEAIWTHPRSIEQAHGATRIYPYQAHNGYYEMMLGLGRVGLVLFVAFLVVAAWRAFRYAWPHNDLVSLWPLSFIVFAVVVNFSESLFISSEALWALTVAAAVAVTQHKREPG